MKNKIKSEIHLDSNLKEIFDKAIKEWKIVENGCKSAYFISDPKNHLDNLLNGKQ